MRRLFGSGNTSAPLRLVLAAACLLRPLAPACGGEDSPPPPSSETLSARAIDERFRRLEGMVEELARQNKTLLEENRRLTEEVRSRPRASAPAPFVAVIPS